MSDRKYRHRGYQDSGSSSGKSEGGSRPPMEPRKERLEGSPRGRTAGGFGPQVFRCSGCGEAVRALGEIEIGHDTACVKCEADLHTCSNCVYFDTTTLWECRSNPPERVTGKRVRNQCTLFQPKMVADLAADKGRGPESADDARKAFDALFKK